MGETSNRWGRWHAWYHDHGARTLQWVRWVMWVGCLVGMIVLGVMSHSQHLLAGPSSGPGLRVSGCVSDAGSFVSVLPAIRESIA